MVRPKGSFFLFSEFDRKLKVAKINFPPEIFTTRSCLKLLSTLNMNQAGMSTVESLHFEILSVSLNIVFDATNFSTKVSSIVQFFVNS